MAWLTCSIMGRRYRYSSERFNTGRPCEAEYHNPKLGWRRVRNSDTLSRIWDIADGKAVDVTASRICKHLNKISSCGIKVCMDCGEPLNGKARTIAKLSPTSQAEEGTPS